MYGLSKLNYTPSPGAARGGRTSAKSAAAGRASRRRAYAAAADSRLNGDWVTLNENVNTVIGSASPVVRARIRQLVRDFPYFKRAVKLVTNYAVGAGITFQARVQDSQGQLLTAYNQQIEDVFNRWAEKENADVAGKLHYYEMMALAKRQDMECGEFLLVKTRPRRAVKIPYCLQIYEADWLDTSITGSGSNPVEQGLEYDKTTGEIIAYHLTDPDSWGKANRVKAENVIHGFETERPGQLRGISPLVAAVLMAHNLADYMEAELDRAKMTAKHIGTIETSENFELGDDGPGQETDGDKKLIEFENAIIERLEPGEKLNFAANPNPSNNMPPFVKLMLCMLAIVAEVPYELLSGDYQGLNYSVGRMVRNDFTQQLKPTCTRHIRHFCTPTIRPWYDAAILSGELKLPNYYSKTAFWQRCTWQPPGMESIDPGRETKSMINQVKNLLRSPQEIVAARGRNFEDVVNEIAVAHKMAAAHDLTFEDVSTALANNPDKIEAQK